MQPDIMKFLRTSALALRRKLLSLALEQCFLLLLDAVDPVSNRAEHANERQVAARVSLASTTHCQRGGASESQERRDARAGRILRIQEHSEPQSPLCKQRCMRVTDEEIMFGRAYSTARAASSAHDRLSAARYTSVYVV